jgi:hypothetical protein
MNLNAMHLLDGSAQDHHLGIPMAQKLSNARLPGRRRSAAYTATVGLA